MKPRNDGVSRGQRTKNVQGQGTNWILIAGGALLSTLSIRLGFKLKQTLDSKHHGNANNALKGFILIFLLLYLEAFFKYEILLTCKTSTQTREC